MYSQYSDIMAAYFLCKHVFTDSSKKKKRKAATRWRAAEFSKLGDHGQSLSCHSTRPSHRVAKGGCGYARLHVCHVYWYCQTYITATRSISFSYTIWCCWCTRTLHRMISYVHVVISIPVLIVESLESHCLL